MATRLLVACVVLTLAACGNESTSGSTDPEGIVAGSYEDWCDEHEVPESACTRCDPALIPAFQARGDWCAEHGLPESQCRECHPDLVITRGARVTTDGPADDPRAHDDAHEEARAASEGTRVTLASPEIARRAGLDTFTLAAPRDVVPVHVTARIAADLSRIARLSARVPGVVGEVRVDVGDRVEAGQVLAWIDSSAVGADRSRLGAAAARRATADAALARITELRASGVSSERDLLAAREEVATARAEHDALRASLRAVGGGGASRYAISAPIAGIITSRAAIVGAAAESGDVLFEIVDTSELWAELAIPERDVARVIVGSVVHVRVAGLEDRAFDTTVSFVSPEIETHTRTVRGRARLTNTDGALRVNALAEGVIEVPTDGPTFVVPTAALQEVSENAMVFVRVSDLVYEVRRVEVVAEPDADTRLVSGRLATGDHVVTTGSFLLRTETIPDGIGAGCCEGSK